MLNVSQEPFVSAWDQAIEQGKDMMRPTIEAMQQAMQKKLQKEQQARQTMQAEIDHLKAQLA